MSSSPLIEWTRLLGSSDLDSATAISAYRSISVYKMLSRN